MANIDNNFDYAFDNNLDLTEYSIEFSEGDNLLKETLINLWKNGIKTFGCCKGHSYEKYDYIPYVSIVVDDNATNYLINMFNSIYSLQDGVDFTINTNRVINKVTFSVNMRNGTKDDTLSFMSKCADKLNINTPNNNVYSYLKYLIDYSEKENIKINYNATNKAMDICFTASDNNYDYLPCVPTLCDEQYLGELVEHIKSNQK